MTFIFEGQPPKTRPLPMKTRVIWVPGYYILSLLVCNYIIASTPWLLKTKGLVGGRTMDYGPFGILAGNNVTITPWQETKIIPGNISILSTD